MKNLFLLLICSLYSFVMQAQCVDNGNYWNESWMSCTVSTNPNPARAVSHWILYEFHEPQYIDSSHIWNANRTGESALGAKDVVIDYSPDGTTWTELGTYTFPQADESSTYQGFEGPVFGGVFLHKILITVLNTYDNGSCASIAEVQFKIDPEACYGIVDACGICDGPGETTWYVDADGDGLGNPTSSVDACIQPAGYVENNNDNCDNGALGWDDVFILFDDNGCLGCHGNNASGGLDLRTYATASLGGNTCGSSILSGNNLVGIITIPNYDACGSPIGFPPMNDRVGGAFDATELATLQAWVDGGAPENCTDYCPENETITLDYLTGALNTHQVSQQINASNLVGIGANITFDAGTQICLDPGFEVENGAIFHAMIGGCSSTFQSNQLLNK